MTFQKLILKSHREADDNYRGEVLRYGHWRIIVCRDHLQWIIQRQTRALSPAGPRWKAEHYCATKKAVMRLWPGSLATVQQLDAMLPEHVKFFSLGCVA